jgi:uncharacterized SAM-binding protein YcdF (DUF218 family)
MISLYRLYDSLTRNDAIEPVDLIFVFAGRMERKAYALELYRAGIAPRLLLSIGRFEVSKMRNIGFESAAELIARRDRLAPDDRHFFCEISAAGTHIETARLRRWNTYGEVLGLRQYLQRDMPRSVGLVSTDVHLRRIALAFDKVFRDAPVKASYWPVPAGASSLRREEFWVRSDDRQYVLKELLKLPAYRMILGMPQWLIHRLMGLKS